MLVLVSVEATSAAQGETEFTLAGGGASTYNLSDNALGLSTSLGYYVTDNIDASVRQSVFFNDAAGSDFSGSTGIGLDYNLRLGNLVPFAGVQASVAYGIGHPAWAAGPEIGAKFYVREKTFVFGRAAYDFRLNDRNGSKDDGLKYTIGIGCLF